MRKSLLSILIIVLLFVQFSKGEEVYSFNSEISVNEYNHVAFKVLRHIELEIEGTSSEIIDFMVMDQENYQKWLDQFNFTTLYRAELLGEFFVELTPVVALNSTINFLFHNTGNNTANLDLLINEILPTTEETPFLVLSFFIVFPIMLILYRKSIQSS